MKNIMAEMKRFEPVVYFHPGVTLEEKLQEMGMGAKEFAMRTGKPEKTIFAVINGNSSVTPDMAIAFESVTRIPASMWLISQQKYDEYLSRKKRDKRLAAAGDWVKGFPYAEMAQQGWVEPEKAMVEKAKRLLSFFMVSSVKAWEGLYLNQGLKLSFNISLKKARNPYALSAWLRRGEIQAEEVEVGEYSGEKLRARLPEMKKIMAEAPGEFHLRLQEECAVAGLKLIYTPCLQNAPVNGCARWIRNSPCIQLSGRTKKYESFWFTFFHEVGHILLHGKKNIFLEELEYEGLQVDKEKQADSFANRMLLSLTDEREILRRSDHTPEAIQRYALTYGTHPSIIAARLKRIGLLPPSAYTGPEVKVELF